jgi:hypothetical protein
MMAPSVLSIKPFPIALFLVFRFFQMSFSGGAVRKKIGYP